MATGSVEELEEERRLFYVACTRARNALEISWPLRYHHNRQHPTDRHGWAQLSRLITPEVGALLDAASAGPVVPDDPPVSGSAAVAAVDARLAELWA
jgi:DNA helicase-2/ATP-dependent DNA helicase PcrA